MRRLPNLIAAAALVALLATLGLWAGGSRRAGTLRWPRGEAKATFFAAWGGGLYVVTSTANQPPDRSWSAVLRDPGSVEVIAGGRTVATIKARQPFLSHPPFGGFRTGEATGPRVMFVKPSGGRDVCAVTSEWVVIPHWFIWLACSVPLAAWLVSRRRDRRARWRAARGLCLRCGYDLRSSPGRCPECGAASTAVQAA